MAALSLGTMMQIGFRLITYRGEIEKLLPQISKAIEETVRLMPQVRELLIKIAPEFFGQAAAKEPKYDVAWVQRSLNALTNAGLVVDNDYGPLTKKAIEDFQTSLGLVVDGWAGAATCAAIDAELAKRRGA